MSERGCDVGKLWLVRAQESTCCTCQTATGWLILGVMALSPPPENYPVMPIPAAAVWNNNNYYVM